MLGYFYYKSLKEYDKAIIWYTKAYELACSGGVLNLGSLYEDLKKREKSIYWYCKAADMGEDGAIGYLYRESIFQ